MARLGRNRLIWIVTVRANDAKGCHLYGLYATKVLALKTKERLERELSEIQAQYDGLVASQHWVNCFAQPLHKTGMIDKRQLERFAQAYRPRVVQVTP